MPIAETIDGLARPDDALAMLDPTSTRYASEAVDLLLRSARAAGASDLHFQPEADALAVHWRIDGVLQPVATIPSASAPNVVARLKVLAELLTYRTEVPQEGRIRTAPGLVETRVSTFPTLHGERAVVRLFADPDRLLGLEDLSLPIDILESLRSALGRTSGLLVICGPAGAGKTTTLYACLRALAAASGGRRCIATLEDPIEAALPGVVQSQANPSAGFTLEGGLRSLLRQDPEVIAVGEIRDPATAMLAFGAALTGHLVLTTFHAGNAAGAIGRLLDMGIEPYLLRSGLRAILAQRLARRLCDACARAVDPDDPASGSLPIGARTAVGCPSCRGTGYQGRIPLAQLLDPESEAVARAVLQRAEVGRIEDAAVEAGMTTLLTRAQAAVADGLTDPAEILRILGHPNRDAGRDPLDSL